MGAAVDLVVVAAIVVARQEEEARPEGEGGLAAVASVVGPVGEMGG